MNLAVRSRQEEQMDAADLPPVTYAVVLADLARVNRATLAARPTLGFLARIVGDGRFTLLDVGFGQGDMLRRIARWAGARAELVGIDLNPASAPAARLTTPDAMHIDYRTGDYAELGRFDVVVSSLVAHHMSDAEIIAFLRWMEANAALGWIVNDLHRHGFAHRGYPLLARLMRVHPIVRQDGTLSIARAFRPADWRALLDSAGVQGARIVRRFPFRLCVERIR